MINFFPLLSQPAANPLKSPSSVVTKKVKTEKKSRGKEGKGKEKGG